MRLVPGLRAAALVGVSAVLLLAPACSGSAAPAPVNHNGTLALHRLLERGVAAERRIGTARFEMLETLSADGHTGQIGSREITQISPVRSEGMTTTSIAGRNTTVRTIVIGHTMYLSGGAFAKLLPAGRTWLREPLAKVSAAVGFPDQSGQLLDELSASSKLSVAGHAVVDGQQTTEYRFVMNFNGITAKAAKSSMFGQLAPLLRGVEMPIRLWVSGQGLPLRETSSFSYKGLSVSLTANMTYGVPVHVTAPPAALVASPPAGSDAGSGATSSGL